MQTVQVSGDGEITFGPFAVKVSAEDYATVQRALSALRRCDSDEIPRWIETIESVLRDAPTIPADTPTY